MTVAIEDFRIIDVDTHVAEPADLWTSRVSVQRWGDLVPHVRWDPDGKIDRWWWAGQPSLGSGLFMAAGWPEFPPGHPPRMADGDAGAYDPVARLQRMDDYGIYAHVLYPNLAGFGSAKFMELREPELMLACVRAYNDWLAEWRATSERFVPIMALPFWDLEETLLEIKRAAALGHKGILFAGDPDRFGQPALAAPYWNPVWELAQDLELPINFHIGNSDDVSNIIPPIGAVGRQTNNIKAGVGMFMSCSRHVVEVIVTGLCARYPRLKFVTVESGVGWVPFLLEALDWQFDNFGGQAEHPEMTLRPSEYFLRQIYACFWFETKSALAAIGAIGSDNFMYETDYPHPTSMSPGPASTAIRPVDFVKKEFSHLPEDVLRKLLHGNAAKVYGLD